MKNDDLMVVCCVCNMVIRGTKTEGGLVSHGYCISCYNKAIEKLTEEEEKAKGVKNGSGN